MWNLSVLAGSFVFWIILAFVAMKYGKRFGLPLQPKMAFWGILLVGLVMSGVGAKLFAADSLGDQKTKPGAESATLGTVTILDTSFTDNNLTNQDSVNRKQANVEATVLTLVGSALQYDVNTTFTIERTSPNAQAASCEVKIGEVPAYQNPYDQTDNKNYIIIPRDSYGRPKCYIDSTTNQMRKNVGFAEGTVSATLNLLCEVDNNAYANITNNGYKQFNVDICGQDTLAVVIKKIST